MATIITGEVYFGSGGERPIRMPIGPFADSNEANDFMQALLPLWGEWQVETLIPPHLG